MKKILFGVLLQIFLAGIVVAQSASVTLDTSDRKSPLSGTIKNNLLSQGSLSHRTSRGIVYTLPYDNMPCLVPHMDQVVPMPGSIQRVPESRMPNAIPQRELIPKAKKAIEKSPNTPKQEEK